MAVEFDAYEIPEKEIKSKAPKRLQKKGKPRKKVYEEDKVFPTYWRPSMRLKGKYAARQNLGKRSRIGVSKKFKYSR